MQWFICHGYLRTITLMTFVACLTNIILNALMIPRLGLQGAAIATVISQLIPWTFLLLLSHGRDNLKIFFLAFLDVLNIKKIFKLLDNEVNAN